LIRPAIPWQALLIDEEDERILVIADLHLGFEHELAQMGINLPSQTPKLQAKLTQILEEIKPTRLIILGDVKQSVPKISLQEWEDIPIFFEEIQKAVGRIEVISGNHDGDLEPLTPHAIKIFSPKGIIVGKEEKVALLHGHAWPSPELLEADYIVIGHNHPVVHFRDSIGFRVVRQIWLKANCNGHKLAEAFLNYAGVKFNTDPTEAFKKEFNVEINTPQLIVIPAFNEILGGLPINLEKPSTLLGPLLRSEAVDIDGAEAYLLDGTFLGVVKQLRKMG